MKPKNFPERVNERRKRALARLQSRLPSNMAHATVAQRQELHALQSRIVSDARGIRTKKQRGQSPQQSAT